MGDIIGCELDFTIIAGRNLVAKDSSGVFGLGKKTSSDPYVVVKLGDKKKLAETQVVRKTLNPEWNETAKHVVDGRSFKPAEHIVFSIFDRDKSSRDDPMGEVRIALQDLLSGQVVDKWYTVLNCKGCQDASGELHLRISAALRRALSLNKSDTMQMAQTGMFAVGLGWDMIGTDPIDLDTSCVAVSFQGTIVMEECVYFAQLVSRSGAIRHTGDEREGDEDLGQGDDEIITVDLDRVPPSVCALYFIATVATMGRTFADVKTAKMRLVDWKSGAEKCRYCPAMAGAHTALFMARVARPAPRGKWSLQAIGEVDHTARDWGTLVPEVKAYTRDLVPSIKVDIAERVAIMRKGGVIRVRDYTRDGAPGNLVLGLAWDVTDGVSIDLDASAILLDEHRKQVDLVFFGKLASSDGSIRHGGDQRTGAAKGDDELIYLNMPAIHPAVKYIGFVINSYSGQELDDVKDASCHLFDGGTYRDLAKFHLTNTAFLDKHTALLVGMLYRDDATGEWAFEIISEAAQGRTAHENTDELQRHIASHVRHALAPPRLPPGAAAAMLARTASALGGVAAGAVGLVRTLSGRLLGGGQSQQQMPVLPVVPGREVTTTTTTMTTTTTERNAGGVPVGLPIA